MTFYLSCNKQTSNFYKMYQGGMSYSLSFYCFASYRIVIFNKLQLCIDTNMVIWVSMILYLRSKKSNFGLRAGRDFFKIFVSNLPA